MSRKPDLKLIHSPQCRETYFHQGTQQTLLCNRPEGHGGSFHEGIFPRLKDDSPFANLSGGKWLWPTVDSIFNQQMPPVPLVTMTAEELRVIIHALYSIGDAAQDTHKDLIQKFEAALEGTQ